MSATTPPNSLGRTTSTGSDDQQGMLDRQISGDSTASSSIKSSPPPIPARPASLLQRVTSLTGRRKSDASEPTSAGTADDDKPRTSPHTRHESLSNAATAPSTATTPSANASKDMLATYYGSFNANANNNMIDEGLDEESAAEPVAAASSPALTLPFNSSASSTLSTHTPTISREDNSVMLQHIHAQFHNPQWDCRVPSYRALVKQGPLEREIRMGSNHDRMAFLFGDVLLLAKPAAEDGQQGNSALSENLLVQKQLFDLRDVTVQEHGSKPNHFTLYNLPDKTTYTFIAANHVERQDWVLRIAQQARTWQQQAPSRLTSFQSSGGSKQLKGRTASDSQSNAASAHQRRVSQEELFQQQLATATVSSSIQSHNDDVLMHLLSENGADPNQISDLDTGYTPMHVAVASSNPQAIMFLLAHGADIDSPDNDGNSALTLACRLHEYGIAMLLIGKHANVNATNQQGMTPLWTLATTPIAEEPGHAGSSHKHGRSSSASESLQQSGGESDEDDAEAAANAVTTPTGKAPVTNHSLQRYAELIRLLLDEGADVTTTVHPGTQQTLLHTLIADNLLVPLKVMVEHTHSILHSIDKAGRAALHHAVSLNQLEACKLLLRLGAAPNLRDHQLNTPLHLARTLAIAVLLVMNGSRMDLQNNIRTRAGQYFETLADESEKAAALTALREAGVHWSSRADTFTDGEQSSEVIPDSSSDSCLLCSQQFSLTVRRHHCKRCGTLCCWACSTKNYSYRAASNAGEKLKSCDSCYNVLAHKQLQYDKLMRRQRSRQATVDEQVAQLQIDRQTQRTDFEQRRKEQEQRIADKRSELLARATSDGDQSDAAPPAASVSQKYSSAASSSSASTARKPTIGQKAATMSAVMSDNRRLLEERGQRLDETADKAGELEDDASNFASLAKQLRKKQQSSFFGLF